MKYVPETPHGTGPAPSTNGNGVRVHPVTDLDQVDQEMKFVSSPHFVLTAATVTFKCPGSRQVLIVQNSGDHYNTGDFFSLPGGRKRVGEDLRSTAMSNTFMETGYRVCLAPVKIPTRAMNPYPGHSTESLSHDIARLWENSTTDQNMFFGINEPLGMSTWTDTANNCTVVRFYFLAYLEDHFTEEEPRMRGPETDPHSTAEWEDVEVALEKMRFKAEKDAIQTAMGLETVASERNRESRIIAWGRGHVQQG